MMKNLFVPTSLIGCSFASSLLAFALPVKADTEVAYEKQRTSEEVPSQIINLIVGNQGNETLEVPTTSPNSSFNPPLPTSPTPPPPPPTKKCA